MKTKFLKLSFAAAFVSVFMAGAAYYKTQVTKNTVINAMFSANIEALADNPEDHTDREVSLTNNECIGYKRNADGSYERRKGKYTECKTYKYNSVCTSGVCAIS
ncbi:MAG: NVEALA domain-containing protein [Bacteroidaceae bacterium]|nr:NVEALA domain-containing protein [Bacteroidaceae bacterium]